VIRWIGKSHDAGMWRGEEEGVTKVKIDG